MFHYNFLVLDSQNVSVDTTSDHTDTERLSVRLNLERSAFFYDDIESHVVWQSRCVETCLRLIIVILLKTGLIIKE